jgi:cytochrome c biogenesis protein CcmG, thiol:disulfide interchange protein DsbE
MSLLRLLHGEGVGADCSTEGAGLRRMFAEAWRLFLRLKNSGGRRSPRSPWRPSLFGASVLEERMRMARSGLALLLILLLGALAGCSKKEGPSMTPTRAPEFSLTSAEGRTVRLSDYQGQVVLVDFWATWCPPCRVAVPHMVELQKEYGPQGFIALGLSMDENAEDLTRFLERTPVNYPILKATEETRGAFGGVISIPQVFLIDRKGMIREKYLGFTNEIGEKMRHDIQLLLQESV